MHKHSAALPAGPTPDVLVWYVLTPAQSRQRLQTALLYSVCAPAAVSVPARHVYSQTVNATVVIALSTWQMTWRV